MNRVLLARLIDLVVVLFGVSIIVFLMIRLIPGDAVAIMLGANTEITPERMAELNRRVGLDRPIVEQYLLWAGAALRRHRNPQTRAHAEDRTRELAGLTVKLHAALGQRALGVRLR